VDDESQDSGRGDQPDARANTTRSSPASPSSSEARSTWRSVLTHPLMLVLVPAVASIIVALIALPKSCSGPHPDHPESASPGPPAAQQGGIAFRVDTDLEAYRGHWAVAFDGPLPPTNDFPTGKPRYTDVYSWAKTRGAIDVGQSHLRLLLQNNGSDRITIRSISAKVIERLRPITVTYVQAPSAGTNDLVDLSFNLDSGDVVAAQPENTGPEGSQADTSNLPFFSTKDVTLDPGESTDIKITTRTALCHCTYDFEVQVVKPNSTDTLEIGDVNGRPLAITAPAEQYQNRYEDGQLACQSYSLFRMNGAMADCSRPA
jgi:hypothetical protein